MARRDNLHSRLVVWLKVALPLAALAALSTLFLVSRRIDPADAIPYATVDVEERAREPRMTAPTYAGVTSDGASLTLSADEARPEAATGATAGGVRGELSTPDGTKTRMTAATAALDPVARRLTMGGGVRIETGAGLVVTTDTLTADLDQTGLESAGPVAAGMPSGTLRAGRMTMTRRPGDPATYEIVFSQGVRLVYVPPRTEP